METKACKHCGEEFERPENYSTTQWERRLFCGRACASRSKPRKTSSGICEACDKWAQTRRYGKLCVPCHYRERYKAEKEHRLAVNRAWREANPQYWDKDQFRQKALDRGRERRYGGLYERVLERDAKTCQKCGIQGEVGVGPEHLCVHHVDGDQHQNTMDNLVVLCNACHARHHAKRGDYFGDGRWASHTAA